MKHLGWIFATCIAGAAVAAACGGTSDELLGTDPNGTQNGNDGGPNGDDDGPLPGGELADEQFPPDLLGPYTGPAINYYDNSFVNYLQLRARIKRVFNDPTLGDAYFSKLIAPLGGADFVTQFTEQRAATSDFLLALDSISRDACANASQNKTGPFAGTDPNVGAQDALVTTLYQRMLFRSPSAQEITDGKALVTQLIGIGPNNTSSWAGLCEALVRHPDALFTLPPSIATASDADKPRLRLIKLTNDFLGRLPTDDEFTTLASKSVDEILDVLFAAPEFRDYYFHRARIRTESSGQAETDEPGRLWTYVMTNDRPFQEVLTADYSVDSNFAKADRPAYHGKTGVLTMPGFIKPKPGLPHYNYSARVLTDYMGIVFEVTPEILASRSNATTPTSTVSPGSVCIQCHGLLTPLAVQRTNWNDDGTYRNGVDKDGKPIDDSDQNLVPDYPYKGKGMEAFATVAVRKEGFLRKTFDTQYQLFMGRAMRYKEDERTVYRQLWRSAFDDNGNLKATLRIIAKNPSYLGQ